MRVFRIAYDEMLLISRAELLKSRGYEVSSALGNDGAKRILDKRERYRMVRWLKAHFPNTKILVVNPPSSAILAGADYNVMLNPRRMTVFRLAGCQSRFLGLWLPGWVAAIPGEEGTYFSWAAYWRG
jgi:hypothetical protein